MLRILVLFIKFGNITTVNKPYPTDCEHTWTTLKHEQPHLLKAVRAAEKKTRTNKRLKRRELQGFTGHRSNNSLDMVTDIVKEIETGDASIQYYSYTNYG